MGQCQQHHGQRKEGSLSLLPKINGHLGVEMRDGKIVKFASGFNEQTFFKFIHDGMFALDREEESMKKTGSKPAAIETRGCHDKGVPQ